MFTTSFETAYDKVVQPIPHQAFFGRVGVNKAIAFTLGTFQIIFTLIKISFE